MREEENDLEERGLEKTERGRIKRGTENEKLAWPHQPKGLQESQEEGRVGDSVQRFWGKDQ